MINKAPQKRKSPSRKLRDQNRMTKYNEAKSFTTEMPFSTEEHLLKISKLPNKLQKATELISHLKKDIMKLQCKNAELQSDMAQKQNLEKLENENAQLKELNTTLEQHQKENNKLLDANLEEKSLMESTIEDLKRKLQSQDQIIEQINQIKKERADVIKQFLL